MPSMESAQLPLGSYEHHHHHHLMPTQQPQQTHNGSLPVGPPDSYQPRRTDVSHLHSSSAGSPCMAPTWTGFIHTTYDALMVLEACLQGKLSHIPRRPHDRERQQIIAGGNVFIYEENASGIKRWTDGVTWSPSRIMGNFLVYRELSEPFPAGEKKKAKKRKRGGDEVEPVVNQNLYSEEDRKLVGSLVDSYGFKPFGLIKKTLNVKYHGVNHHIVSYYNLEDVKSGAHKRPKHDARVHDVIPRDEILNQNNFKVSAVDPDEDLIPVDPFHSGLPPAMPSATVYGQQPALHVFTNGQQMQPQDHGFAQMQGPVMSPSPHSSLSANTPIDYFQYPYTPNSTQYIGQNLVEGMHHGNGREDRMDSVIASQQPHFKTEMPDLSDISVFTPIDDGSSPVGSALTHSMSQPADMYAVHHGLTQPHYTQVDGPNNWPATSNNFHDQLTMPPNKRRQTAPIMTMALRYAGQPATRHGQHSPYAFQPAMTNASSGQYVV